MHKVVIIDDEPIILKGLTEIVPWGKYDCTLAGTAESGMEGMEVIRREEPDIIITDICMPKMDGLTMIAALKSEFANMEICILTGYRDFDYAQKAITLGVTRFLLKPSNPEQIEGALEVMTENLKRKNPVLEKETKKESNEGASSFIVNNAVSYMRKHYSEHLTLSEVAEQIYVSQWHLSKLLKRYTEKNFSEILNQIRIDQAKELLREPSLRIGDIAEQVGFLDIAHFSKVFKKCEGISANEYRNVRI